MTSTRCAVAIALYHGFGANLWSWKDAGRPLALRLNALVTSHDMPGFGLTQRPSRPEQYWPPTNGAIGRRVMDHELVSRDLVTSTGEW